MSYAKKQSLNKILIMMILFIILGQFIIPMIGDFFDVVANNGLTANDCSVPICEITSS